MDVLNYVASDQLLLIGIICWLVVVSVVLYKKSNHRTKVTLDHSTNSAEVTLQVMSRIGEVQLELSTLQQRFDKLNQSFKTSIQHIGLVRYSAFDDTGGDQSFALALLDSELSGVVISALHGRDKTRLYTKKLINGTSETYALSEEEKAAITQAKGNYSSH